MSSHSKPTTLFSLPAELRIVIYQYVVFHDQTDGIIAPIISGRKTFLIVSLVDGERFGVSENGRPALDHGATSDDTPEQRQEKVDLADERRRFFNRSSNARSNHFCTPLCLLQPPITLVNKQLRSEVLPVFYEVNRFHFEMGNFPVTQRDGRPSTGESWSPTRWWRAIGDTNLRSIGRISFTCHPSVEFPASLSIEIQQSPSRLAMATKPVKYLLYERSNHNHALERLNSSDASISALRFVQYRSAKRERCPNAQKEEDVFQEFQRLAEERFEVLRTSGIHVRGLEALLITMEPCDREYVADHASLDDGIEVGFTLPGRGERAFQYNPF
jgi:hypothetical protein